LNKFSVKNDSPFGDFIEEEIEHSFGHENNKR
jgi:hypothetical protein